MNENISKMIQHVRDGNKTEAGKVFNKIMAEKSTDALEQKRVEVAAKIYKR